VASSIQSQYARKACDTWVAEASKLGEMYVAVARDAYKPVEQAVRQENAEGALRLLKSHRKEDPGP